MVNVTRASLLGAFLVCLTVPACTTAQGAAEVRVSYDPLLRYPTTVFIDRSVRIADEEQHFEMSGLAPAR